MITFLHQWEHEQHTAAATLLTLDTILTVKVMRVLMVNVVCFHKYSSIQINMALYVWAAVHVRMYVFTCWLLGQAHGYSFEWMWVRRILVDWNAWNKENILTILLYARLLWNAEIIKDNYDDKNTFAQGIFPIIYFTCH